MSRAAARNSCSSSLAPRNRQRKIFTEGILRPSADLCKCHGAGAVQTAGGPRPPPAPRRAPPSCKLQPMKTIAIEEHFITPMYRQKVAANEFRNFYLRSRSEQIGHDIVEQNSDLGAKRLAHMDAAGIDVQVLSFGSPGPQGFAADVAIPMARDANDLAHEAVKAHPDRFAAFAALATADPGAASDELGRAAARRGLAKTPLQYLKDNLLVTTSGNWYEPAFLCTLLALGADNILFAVDWPYEPNTAGMEFLKKLSISDADREKIAHRNAERILRM